MPNLTAGKEIKRAIGRGGVFTPASGAVAIFHPGSLVFVVASAPTLVTPNTNNGGRAVGVCVNRSTVNNVVADPNNVIETEAGIFLFDIDAADAVTNADIGNTVFATDNQTVSKTNATATKSIAGTLVRTEIFGTVTRAWVAVSLPIS